MRIDYYEQLLEVEGSVWVQGQRLTIITGTVVVRLFAKR